MSDKQLIILLIIILVVYLAIKPQVYEGLPPPSLPKPKDNPPLPPQPRTYTRSLGTMINPNGSSTTTLLINQEGWSEEE